MCVFITAGPSTKLFAWGGGYIGGHVLKETTSRSLCGLVRPSRTSERGGGALVWESNPKLQGGWCDVTESVILSDRYRGVTVRS